MKKLLALFMLYGALTFGVTGALYAQDNATGEEADQSHSLKMNLWDLKSLW